MGASFYDRRRILYFFFLSFFKVYIAPRRCIFFGRRPSEKKQSKGRTIQLSIIYNPPYISIDRIISTWLLVEVIEGHGVS